MIAKKFYVERFVTSHFFPRCKMVNYEQLANETGTTVKTIKSSQTYHTSFADKLHWLGKELKAYKVEKVVLYDGTQEWEKEELKKMNYRNYFLNRDK